MTGSMQGTLLQAQPFWAELPCSHQPWAAETAIHIAAEITTIAMAIAAVIAGIAAGIAAAATRAAQ